MLWVCVVLCVIFGLRLYDLFFQSVISKQDVLFVLTLMYGDQCIDYMLVVSKLYM